MNCAVGMSIRGTVYYGGILLPILGPCTFRSWNPPPLLLDSSDMDMKQRQITLLSILLLISCWGLMRLGYHEIHPDERHIKYFRFLVPLLQQRIGVIQLSTVYNTRDSVCDTNIYYVYAVWVGWEKKQLFCTIEFLHYWTTSVELLSKLTHVYLHKQRE
jgi:hypothetical protein